MRKGTKARIERRKRALACFQMVHQVDWERTCFPLTNIKRWRTEDEYAAYFANKIKERASLQVRLSFA